MPIDNTGLPWEARGTVSLAQNSNIVSGVGTSFADNVRPRDALFVEGFEQPLEISSVNGATEIQLENEFVGADIVGANFKILRGYNWNLVAKLAATQAELLAQWRNIQTVYQSESPPQNANEGSINFNVADVVDPRFQIKENGTWSDSYTLRGPVGLGWISGDGEPSNTTGDDGYFYLNLIDSEYHGPKENGIWPSATKIKGDKGDSGTIGIGSIITGQPGTDVQVINSGTEEDVILDISIPRGDPFIINAEGFASNRTLFDDEFEGFVFYETDNQHAFQRIGPSGQWIGPLVFGAGDMSGENNLSELTDIGLARQNLGAMSGENNLSELTDIGLARQNLGAMSGENNLSELTDIGLARQNLGAMSGDNNLSELTDIEQTYENLGIEKIHTLKKQNTTDDAGLILQSGSIITAKFGLLGDDNISLKYSADGSAFNDGLVINKATGIVNLPSGLLHSGSNQKSQVFINIPSVSNIFRIDSMHSPNPRVKAISSVASDIITLTSSSAAVIFDNNYMLDNVYVRIWNISKSTPESAWAISQPADNQIQVLNAADLSGWATGETIQVGDPASITPNNAIAIDISPLMLKFFGQVFRQSGMFYKYYVSGVTTMLSATQTVSVGLSADASNSSFINGVSNNQGVPGQGVAFVNCSVLSPISNSNLIYARESGPASAMSTSLIAATGFIVET